MAPKVTPEQKLLNKEAVKARQKAFTARKNAWRAEREKRAKLVDDGPLGAARYDSNQAFEDAWQAREAEMADLKAQIAALQQKLKDAAKDHDDRAAPLKAARDAAWSAHYAAKLAAEKSVDAQYPDVASCYTAAAWKPLDEFLPHPDTND